MFTGIIELVRPLLAQHQRGSRSQLWVELAPWVADLELGASICVSGACLTVSEIRGAEVGFDLSPETLARTRFGGLQPGAPLNLERALRFSDRLGGHLVSGHVDGLGCFLAAHPAGAGAELSFQVPAELERYLLSKGSIAVDGVSLTIAHFEGQRFSAALIPHTLKATNLASLRPGVQVHLEADMIAKWVERLLPARAGGEGASLEDALRKAGFYGAD